MLREKICVQNPKNHAPTTACQKLNEERLNMHLIEEDSDPAMEMPRYKSHKTIWALEIASADPLTCKLTFRDEGYAPVRTDAEMWSRYKPVPGDFYVTYADGYKSFSPRKAFLDGYTRI